MKTRAIILAGGEGTRLSVLTAKRAKPAVPFAGKYRIIDFPLSNCVNSDIDDVMVITQYRPQSLIEHIGAGGPRDLNRDINGGVRIYNPYKARGADWFIGTADAVQQNFSFIKHGQPDLILILSGDHVYGMDYRPMIEYHLSIGAELTLAAMPVPLEDASRFGILSVDADHRITSFVEKPSQPPSNLANMGIYLFNRDLLDRALWDDHQRPDSTHDFGKDILPSLVADRSVNVYAYHYEDYWVDVGTVQSYWKAHMDLLQSPPPFNLYNREWIIHTRTEERAPVKVQSGAQIDDSLICDGCIIESGAKVIHSILSPGVIVRQGAVVRDSIIFTDGMVDSHAIVECSVLDKRTHVCQQARVGSCLETPQMALVGKQSVVPEGVVLEPGAVIGQDVIASDYPAKVVQSGVMIQTRRLPNEI
jgi:glucose-1-phosphate adenylyltransferase